MTRRRQAYAISRRITPRLLGSSTGQNLSAGGSSCARSFGRGNTNPRVRYLPGVTRPLFRPNTLARRPCLLLQDQPQAAVNLCVTRVAGSYSWPLRFTRTKFWIFSRIDEAGGTWGVYRDRHGVPVSATIHSLPNPLCFHEISRDVTRHAGVRGGACSELQTRRGIRKTNSRSRAPTPRGPRRRSGLFRQPKRGKGQGRGREENTIKRYSVKKTRIASLTLIVTTSDTRNISSLSLRAREHDRIGTVNILGGRAQGARPTPEAASLHPSPRMPAPTSHPSQHLRSRGLVAGCLTSNELDVYTFVHAPILLSHTTGVP